MNLPNPSPLLRSFYTINERLERLERDLQEVRQEVAALRRECSDVGKDVAVLQNSLEQTEKLFEAKMRAVVAETIADLRIQFVTSQAERRTDSSTPALPLADDTPVTKTETPRGNAG